MRHLCLLISLGALTLTLSAGAFAQGADEGPVAAWTFNGQLRRMARDVAGDRHHAIAHADTTYVDAPGGKALAFDGRDTCLMVPGRPELAMSDTVTVDVWVMVDEVDRAEPQCVVEKGGERYRIQLQGSSAMFGLKGEGMRMDLGGGKLTAGAWHRITGVFDRPNASLYVDGELVGQQTWDHAADAGGDLCIGAKAGSVYLFRGKIDELRIYDYPRPPLPTDAPSTQVIGVATVKPADAKMEVEDVDGGVTVDTGAISFELTQRGALRSLTVGDQAIVADNDAPFFAASVLESEDYDGWSDCAIGDVIEATWQPGTHDFKHDDNSFTAALTGRLTFPAGDRIDCSLTVGTSAGSPFLTVTAALQPEGAFENRFIRSAALRLPLALNKRKRVVQAGDRGVQWNTRHWYQFHVNTRQQLMNEPGHNIWRHFAIDQNTDQDYHIWRSESAATTALTMQRGIQAPGWMGVYDERAGLVLAYRGFAERTPKSLRVEADDSGEALIYLWHPGLPALDFNSPQAAAVFGEPHVTDWLAFADDFNFCQPDLALAKRWGVEGLASDPPARNEPPCTDLNLLDAPAADSEAPLVSGGVPLPRGALTDPTNLRLRHDGANVPVQTRIMAYWPDKSIKWLLLTFPADGGEVQGASGEGDALTFDLTRRDGTKSAYRLDFGGTAKMGVPQVALDASQDGDAISINTGPLQLEVVNEAAWLRSVNFEGKNVLAEGGARSFIDFLRADNSYPSTTTHAQGRLDDGGFVPETMELEEAGPLRALVRLQGHTDAEEPTRVIVRIEAYAGRSALRVFQSAEFLHNDVREAYIRRMGIDLPLASTQGAKVTVGGQDGPVALADGIRAGIKQHSHLGYRAWHRAAGERFLRFDEAKHRCRGWLDMTGPNGGVTVMLRDMWQQFPNELAADTERGHLTAYFWPESEPLMDVRRYSNYPHRSQGESAGTESNWVETNYYGQEQFVGVSKTHEILLYFHGPQVAGQQIDAVAADFQRPPLVYAGADLYLNSGVLLPQPVPDPERFPRADANLDHYARFWMHHQRLWGWYGIWDYGDIQHYYRGGYGWIVPADKLVELLQDPPEDYQTIDVRKWRMGDYRPNHEWAFDNGRWGWTNTEGLPGLYMQRQYMRTGDREMYFFAEAMARHVRDVDMRHDGRWLGLGTRHGVQHWSDGNHEERQTTHSDFRYVHYLSGDMRSRDFANFLYERIYSQRDVSIHAAHSGRLQGLLTWWEMTGSDEVADILEKYIPCFLVDEGLCISPSVDFPEVKCLSQERDVNGESMFFWTFGAGHGVLEYYELTRDEALKRALIKVADLALASGRMGNFRKAVIFAARHADDPAPYLERLNEYAQGSSHLVQTVPHNPDFYGGSRGMLRGAVSGSLFVMNDVPYLMSVLDGDPERTEEQWADIRRVDEQGGPLRGAPMLSWQSEYDRPELAEYLRIKHPQP